MSLKIVMAAPFRYQKSGSLKRSAIISYLVLEKKWMKKKVAEDIIGAAEKKKLIRVEGDDVYPLFNPEDVDVPLGFKPGPELFEDKDDPFAMLAERIAEARAMEYNEVIEEIDRIAAEEFDGNLYREAAVFILAKRYDVRAGDLADSLYRQAFKKTG